MRNGFPGDLNCPAHFYAREIGCFSPSETPSVSPVFFFFFWRLPVENKHFLRVYVLSCLSTICPLELVSQGYFLIAECCGRFLMCSYTFCCLWFTWLLTLFYHKILPPGSPSLLGFSAVSCAPTDPVLPATPEMLPSALPWALSSAPSSWIIFSMPDASSALSTHSLPALLPAHASP